MNTRRRFGPIALAGLPLLLLAPYVRAQVTGGETAQAETKRQETTRPTIYDESADVRQVIAEAVARAKKNNRRVLVQWGANWCGWCHLLHGTFKENRTVARKLLYEYDLVLVDVGRFDKNIDLADKYGADLKGNGLPYLTVLDANGEAIANQETASLEKNDGGDAGHNPEKVMDFLTKHEAEPLVAESVLADGLRAAQKKDKVVFLHFGAPWCGWCHRLENWMALDIVEPVLAREFVDVKIDIDRMVGGKEIMAKYRKAPGGGIPWFAFVNGKGEIVATSDQGPNGNLGCPWTAEEIMAFRELLAKVTDLPASDIERITAKLGKQEETPKKADAES